MADTADVHLAADFERATQVSAEQIPLIDFSPFRAAETSADAVVVTDAIGAACRDIGFFYLTGHGVAPHITAAAFEQIRWYFSQPFEWKCALEARPDAYRGYFPPRDVTERSGIDVGRWRRFG